MYILDLVLKHRWYDMIDAGLKREEYREDSAYWRRRLLVPQALSSTITPGYRSYTHIRFHRGYTSTTMLWSIQSMHFGTGRPDWGAPPHRVHIIKLGTKCAEGRPGHHKANGTEYVTIGTSRVG